MSGTKPMGNNSSFTAQELCTIIKGCAEGGVSKITFANGGEIIFNVVKEPLVSTTFGQVTEELVTKQEQVQEQAILQDELRTREDQLEDMLINDPEQYEKLVEQQLIDDKVADNG